MYRSVYIIVTIFHRSLTRAESSRLPTNDNEKEEEEEEEEGEGVKGANYRFLVLSI